MVVAIVTPLKPVHGRAATVLNGGGKLDLPTIDEMWVVVGYQRDLLAVAEGREVTKIAPELLSLVLLPVANSTGFAYRKAQ